MFVVTSVTTLAGTMFDPLVAPWAYGVLHVNAALFGWMLTLQGAGGVIGGLLFGHIRRIRPAQLFGTSSIVVGLILFVMYRTVSTPWCWRSVSWLVSPRLARGLACKRCFTKMLMTNTAAVSMA
ncbi:MAG: hypothetical protein R2867_21250 [Caldilineaceae bacterium]